MPLQDELNKLCDKVKISFGHCSPTNICIRFYIKIHILNLCYTTIKVHTIDACIQHLFKCRTDVTPIHNVLVVLT